jgi:PAS domain S-box-containing protein
MDQAWDLLTTLLQRAEAQPGTETLEQMLQVGVEMGAEWNAIFAWSEQGPLCLLESPHGRGWVNHIQNNALIQPSYRQHSMILPSTSAETPVRITQYPLINGEYLYVFISSTSVACLPHWGAFAGILQLLLKQEKLIQELDTVRAQSEKRLQEVATLYETALAIERYGLQQFLQIITERAAQVMDAQACSLLLMEPGLPALRIAASYGLSEEIVSEVLVRLGEGIAGKVAQSGEPMMITDPGLEPRLRGVKANPDISSSLCVPLRDREGSVFGVLNIRRSHPAPPFTDEDLRLFSVFASQVALALNNAQLYSDLTRRVTELSTLADLTQTVNSTLDIDSLLESIADQIVKVVGFERCALFLSDDSPKVLKPRLLRGYHAGVFNPRGFRRGQGVVGIVAQKGMPLVIENAQEEIQPMKGFGRMIGASSYCALPISVRGHCIGVVVADNRHASQPIKTEQIELLSAFVNQAGIALENARLYREMEQRYREHQNLAAFLDNILHNIGAGVFTFNRNGNVTTWNQAAQTITGLRAKEVRGCSYREALLDAMAPDYQQGLEKALEVIQQVLEEGTPHSLYKINCKWGTIPSVINLTVTPLRDRENQLQGAVVVFEDVSEQVHLEEQMAQMARLAEIGQMTATIAHEIRNPMTALKGAAQLLMQESVSTAVYAYLEIIKEEVAKLTQIADEFLEFARPLTLTRKTLALDQLLQRTLRAFEPYFREHKVETLLEANCDCTIEADPVRLEQVFNNLIQNAVQAMPSGGKLTLKMGGYHDHIYTQVRDTGIGIPEEIVSNIFSPFFTTRTKGTGLGLSIVKKIVDAHHGTIEVTSQPDEGTIFTVWLPKVQA